MQGFSTHVSDPNKKINRATALKNIPEIFGLESYHTIILENRAQLFRDFQRFPITASQLSHAAVNTCPRYLNKVTVSRGHP